MKNQPDATCSRVYVADMGGPPRSTQAYGSVEPSRPGHTEGSPTPDRGGGIVPMSMYCCGRGNQSRSAALLRDARVSAL